MKPKYIKHYKDSLKVRRDRWYVLKRMFFWKNKGKSRIRLLRKYFKPLVLNQQNARAIVIDRMSPVITKEDILARIDKGIKEILNAK